MKMALPITQRYVGTSSHPREDLVTVLGILGALFLASRLLALI